MGIEAYDIRERLRHFTQFAALDIAKRQVADELSGVIKQAFFQLCEERGWRYAPTGTPRISPLNGEWLFQGDPWREAWICVEFFLAGVDFDWQGYIRGVIYHEELHIELWGIIPYAPYVPRHDPEYYIGFIVEDYWINRKVARVYSGFKVYMEIVTTRIRADIPRLRSKLKYDVRWALESILLFLPYDEIKREFPEYPQLAVAKDLMDRAIAPEELRGVYDKLLKEVLVEILYPRPQTLPEFIERKWRKWEEVWLGKRLTT